MRNLNKMWTCPACSNKFCIRNQAHSCGKYTVEEFLEGKSGKAIELFEYFISEYKKIGHFELHPVKTRIALLTKMRFCSINKIGRDYISVHLVLTEPFADVRGVCRIENINDRFFVHHLKIADIADINQDVRKLMTLAYEIGERKHIKEKNAQK